jgi:alpha-tubulin suppressor-like RCC1 family protein
MSTLIRAGRGQAGAAVTALAALGGAVVLVIAGASAAAAAGPGRADPGAHQAAAGHDAARASGLAAVGSALGWGQDSWGQLGNGADPASEPTPVGVSLPSGVQLTGISGGDDHSLAVTSSGQVLAFGRNEVGQLGNGTTTDSDTPVLVSLPSGSAVTQAAAGDGFSYALTASGGVLAWGDNEEGELGDGGTGTTPVDVPVAVQLPSGTSATQVAAGAEDFGLALTSGGQVLSWGDNFAGQLGNGSTTNSATPAPVALPAGVTATQIAAGGDTGYALTSSGTLYAWGSGAGGTLGDGSPASSDTPVPVALPTGITVTQISAEGSFVLALTSAGQVLAWGGNSAGQLGNGSTASSDVPVNVSLPSGTHVRQIAAGDEFGLAATTTGSVLAWGDNTWGELGNGTTTSSDVPVAVSLPSGTRVGTLAAGQDHALALPAPATQVTGISPEDGLPAGGGTLTISGSGFTGATAVRFGTVKAAKFTVVSDSEITATIPAGTGRADVTVTTPLGGTSATTATDQYTYLAKGSVLDWGYGYHGELGDGSTGIDSDHPVAVHLPAGTVVTATADGGQTAYALASSGALYAWGQGGDGELGNGSMTDSAAPVRVSFPAGTVIKSVTAGWQNGYAVTSTGAVYAWGDGEFGALGNSTTSDSDVPVAVQLPAGTKITSLYAQDYGALALTSARTVLGWGYGSDGELGDGTTSSSDVPVAVSLPSGTTVTSIGGAAYEGFAVTSAGAVLGWGYNAYGELGNGTTTTTDVPVKVSLAAGTKVTAVAGGYYTAYALTSTGHVLAWGYGNDGELGNGAQSNSTTPVTVSLPAGTKVAALSTEGYSGLIRTAAGRLLAWGYDLDGDLGDSILANSDVPVAVSLPAGVSATEVGPGVTDGGIAVVSPVPVVTSVSPKSGAKGIKVTITGLNLTGATKVLFGTAAAKFTVVSATEITATVPAGSGKVTVAVTTPLGTASGQFSYTA